MGRKPKPPARLEGWYRLRESGGKGKTFREWDMTLDLQYGGMDFGALRTEMERIEREYKGQFERFKIECDMVPREYEEGEYLVTYVYGWRKETDEEYEARINTAARLEEERREYRRKQYEILAKEFGDKA